MTIAKIKYIFKSKTATAITTTTINYYYYKSNNLFKTIKIIKIVFKYL